MYELHEREVLEKLRELNAKRVLIQTPEGLKKEAQFLAEFLEENGIESLISGEVNYG
ncbi:MAG TPA: S-adenosyl-L-methionine--L-histidine 3-amino-3-carboxypropyltransferase, partial [Thermococcaceae archaeon]|nr:S-adenosyl-L-methionine--L-histidine 3-amino-3-carboxypropyltransferase [Thermococcaceae archaeon]